MPIFREHGNWWLIYNHAIKPEKSLHAGSLQILFFYRLHGLNGWYQWFENGRLIVLSLIDGDNSTHSFYSRVSTSSYPHIADTLSLVSLDKRIKWLYETLQVTPAALISMKTYLHRNADSVGKGQDFTVETVLVPIYSLYVVRALLTSHVWIGFDYMQVNSTCESTGLLIGL